jgi:hypothetical protein
MWLVHVTSTRPAMPFLSFWMNTLVHLLLTHSLVQESTPSRSSDDCSETATGVALRRVRFLRFTFLVALDRFRSSHELS